MKFHFLKAFLGAAALMCAATCAWATIGAPQTLVNSSGQTWGESTNEEGETSPSTTDEYLFTVPTAGAISISYSGFGHYRFTYNGTDYFDPDYTGTLTVNKLVAAGDSGIQITGWDSNDGGSYSVSVVFTPGVGGPTASFTASPSSGPSPLTASFNASATTTDPDATITSYTWDVRGNTSMILHGVTASWVYSTGQYNAMLTVTDSRGLTSTTSRTITANTAPAVPTISKSTPIVGVGQTVSISAPVTDVDHNLTLVRYDYLAPGSSTWVLGSVAAGSVSSGPLGDGWPAYKTFTLSTAGVWAFRIVGIDSYGGVGTSPTAFVTAGPDITVPTPPTTLSVSAIHAQNCLLSWSGATDDVAVTSYEVRRNGTISLGTVTTASMTVTGLSASTTYPLEVRARDAAGNWSAWSAVTSVTTIGLQPPVPSFTVSPMGAPLSTVVNFNASGSVDPNGTISSYVWDFDGNGTNDATTSTAASSATFTRPGIYTAKLTVTSTSGLSASTTRQVPVGIAITTLLNSSGRLNGILNDDDPSDGPIDSYEVQAPGPGLLVVILSGLPHLCTTANGDWGQIAYGEDSSDTGYLTVNGSTQGGTCSISVQGLAKWVDGDYTIQVGFAPAPRPAVAAFTSSVWYGVAPLTVTFDASASVSPDSFISSYTWDFGANGTATSSTPVVTRTFTGTGTYTAKLTVFDGITAPATATKTIIVNGPYPAFVTQPVSQTVDPGATVTLTSVATGSPAPNYQWKRGTDPVTGATSQTLVLSNVTASQAGSYSVTITNSLGSSTSASAVVVVNPDASPPIVTTNPLNQSVTAGDAVTLTAFAAGFPLPTYQWFQNGTAVPRATGASLSFTHIAPSDAGSYCVVATNRLGSYTSTSATVTVQGNRFLISATLGGYAYATAHGGNPGQRIGITAGFDFPPPGQQFFGWDTGAQGGYIDRSDQELTIVTLGPAEFGVTALYCQGSHAVTTVSAPSTAAVGQTFRAYATTSNPSAKVTFQVLQYSWDQGGHWSWDGGFLDSPNNTETSHTVYYDMTPTHTGTVWFRAWGGQLDSPNWPTRVSVFNYFKVEVNPTAPPVILTQPVSQTARVGESVTFAVGASGVPPPTYQWKKNGALIAGANRNTLTLLNVQEGDAGTYTVVVDNGLGSPSQYPLVSNPAVLSLQSIPVITSALEATPWLAGPNSPPNDPPPFSYTITALFCDAAHGPLSYYAFGYPAGLTFDRNTGILSGRATQGGTFPVFITATNSSGTSNLALLILNVIEPPITPPVFTTQPQSQYAVTGSTVTLQAAVLGHPVPTFQWYHDNSPIAGATNVTYAIASAQISDAGGYYLVATNQPGSATSNQARLEVGDSPTPPTITLQPVSQTVTAGGTATFTADAEGSVGMRFQWYKGGQPIADRTEKTLMLSAVTAADGAPYHLKVTNGGGDATSVDATLSVRNPGDDGSPQLRVHRAP